VRRAIAAVIVGAATAARADVDAALPCRPTIACTADLVPPGVVELEAGYLYRRLAGGVDQSSVPWLAKLTVAEWAQVQVGSNGPTFDSAPVPARYHDDVTFGVKLRVHRQSTRAPSLALSATISVPTFAADGYQRTYDALFTLYASKDVGWLHADLNVGANLWRIEDRPLAQAWAALALSATIGGGVGAMLEGYDFGDASPIAPRDAGLLAAVSYAPRPWLVLDAGPDVGLVHATRTISAFVGVTIDPVALWR
jgi:hypothetical protein